MDFRGEFAQPVKPLALGRIASAPRWRRRARRFARSLLRHGTPRGLGSSAAALLLLASVCYGALEGGHWQTVAARVQNLCDDAAGALGFGISEIALSGTHELSRERVLAAAGITGRTSLLFLDAGAARERLLSDPWIADATVFKLYPGRLRIGITERTPFALWQRGGQVSLIAADGTVLSPAVSARFLALPLVVGKGAAHTAHAFLTLVARYPVIARQVAAAVLVAERRWTLYLADGVEVLLPEEDPAHALATLTGLAETKQLLSRDIVAVDLRLADRVAVRLSEAAAAARAARIEAMQKARKARGGAA